MTAGSHIPCLSPLHTSQQTHAPSLPSYPHLQVLADFHVTRNNYQAAAGAMLAYARRLVGECPEDPAMLAEAERALATSVSCLRWVSCGGWD